MSGFNSCPPVDALDAFLTAVAATEEVRSAVPATGMPEAFAERERALSAAQPQI